MFIDYMYLLSEERYKDGHTVVTEGSYGNWIWVILEGVVEISKETPRGPIRIARLGEGCFIGTLLSLMHGDNRRSATVTASGNVHLGVLDTQRLAGEYLSRSPEFRGLLKSMTSRLMRITDRAVDLSLENPNGVQSPGEQSEDRELIIEKGTSFEEALMIKEGNGYILGRSQQGAFPLLTLGQRDVFGYIPFIDLGHEPHFASVFASKNLKYDKLNTDQLLLDYEGLSPTFKGLISDVGNCIAETTRRTCPLQ
jgi:hypothetical protein